MMDERRCKSSEHDEKLERIEKKLDMVFDKIFHVLLSRQKAQEEEANVTRRTDKDRS